MQRWSLPLIVAHATIVCRIISAFLRPSVVTEGTVVRFAARNKAECLTIVKQQVQDDILKHRERSARGEQVLTGFDDVSERAVLLFAILDLGQDLTSLSE